MTDYVVCGALRPERVAAIVSGVAEGCVLAGCALLGGETAEHPGHLGPDDFDLAGAATGVVEAAELLGPDRVRPGDALIATRIYARDCLAVAAGCAAHAFAHITGGGLAANLGRVLPPAADALVDRGTWRPPPVFGLLAAHGQVPQDEMERVFNMGVGMVAVVAAGQADRALALLAAREVPAWLAGQVGTGTGTARLHGRHPG